MSVLPQLEPELLAAHRRLAGRRRLGVLAAIGDRLPVGWLSRTTAAIPVVLAVSCHRVGRAGRTSGVASRSCAEPAERRTPAFHSASDSPGYVGR